MSSQELPAGTVTFLFTDIEGSTQLLKRLGGDRYAVALGDHQTILREAFAEHGGHEIDTQGDSFFVAFGRAKDAVSCAIACQRQLGEHAWPDDAELRVRMGIHTGEPAMGGQRYVGLGVNRGARIAAAGHGGQVLVSQTTRELLRDDPVPEVSLRDLGEHQLKDMDGPERIFQLLAPGLQGDFPELKTAGTTAFEGREDELAEAAAQELARRWRRPARRTLIIATLAAALVGLGVGVLSTQGGGSSVSASVSPNTVGVLDLGGGKVTAEIQVGVAPSGVAASEDAIWVTNTGGNSVSRIDPETNNVRQTIGVGGGPAGIAAGAGAVWVANGLDSSVTRIDADTNLPSQTIAVGNGPTGVAYGQGAVWVTNSTDGTVTRIDPRTGRARKAFPAVVGASGIAYGFGRLWVVSPPTATMVVLEPRTGRLLREIGVGGEPTAVTAGGGAVWVANRADGTVSKIDPRAMAVTDVVPVGRKPVAITAGTESVWVANEGDGTVSRLDLGSGETELTVFENPPRGVASTKRGVYIAVGSRGTEHRGGELKVVGAGLDSIDPAIAYAVESWALLTLTNDGLVGFRKVGGVQGTQLVPDLAVSLPEATDGGRTYTFELRRGVRYSNGVLVQPEDFRNALERVFELGSGGAGYYRLLTGAERCSKGKPCDLSRGVVADRSSRTVTFHLTGPDGDFLAKLAMPWAYAVPVGSPKQATPGKPIPATGPYRIAGYDKRSKTYRLVRNARFREWSADAQPQGFADRITFTTRFGFYNVDRANAVKRGEGDIAPGWGPFPKNALDSLIAQFPDQLRLSTQPATEFFFLNTRASPFDDVQVRRAVSYAFDTERYAEQAGQHYEPACRILPPSFPAHQAACPYTTGGVDRLARARQLVKAAGQLGTRVTVWVPAPHAERGRYMASILRLLDFEADVRVVALDPTMGATPYFDKVGDSRTKAQIGFGGWFADFPSVAGFLPPILSCDAFLPEDPLNSNLAEFCDPSIDEKMARATELQAQDPPAATLLWQEVERDLLAHTPVVPIVHRRNVDFLSKRVGNYQYHPQWGPLLSQLWVK